ncbi:3-methylfumaryl-CoA hydratase [Roseovarius tolerans]|uniref:3-methylfumaryl-CoA hydratase n=1 Tax=Roseovarius tolerans TaxID=74031 RepID=A0A1H8CAJ8_9RHOB|nr:MaoC family dehydratase N-terminal domain-containing protein [Roseovarius tolerans]SEM91899.1 3-methylfumaryl-CoA hydratase [Roseovarius tolerans]
MDTLNIAAWAGRSQVREGGITAALAAQLHATLGVTGQPAPGQGEDMPALWHWCGFNPTAPLAELARDGHPVLGDFLPPVRLSRRMWASGQLRLGAPLRVGEALRQRSHLAKIEEKQGRAGPMVLVTVEHQVFGERGLAIEEVQNIVYLDIPEAFSPPAKQPMPEAAALHEVRPLSEALLFRYSALTFNAHRIHYDLPYAQEVEHYPGLVVHGPLQATWLMQAACRVRGRRPAFFDFRAVHPMLLTDSREAEIMAVEEEGGALRLMSGQEGHQCMQATAIWEETL